MKKTDCPAHHVDGGYTNLHVPPSAQEKGFWSVMKMRFSSEWADHESLASEVPRVEVDRERIASPSAGAQATWLGHSSFLVQYRGMTVLTDPVFSDRASPVSWAGPKRYTPPALSAEELPKIDVVVVSHNHYDHLDLPTIEAIGNGPLWLVPLGNGELLTSVGVTHWIELDWWQSHEINGWTFTATPVQHWSARGLGDRFECLWSGWVGATEGFNFYFAGDTGYNGVDFVETGQRLGPFDLGLIPIGAYAPRWFMKTMHVNPEEAVRIHQDVGARRSLAIHWGTFPLTAERPNDPPRELRKALEAAGLSEGVFQALAIGETVSVQRDDTTETPLRSE